MLLQLVCTNTYMQSVLLTIWTPKHLQNKNYLIQRLLRISKPKVSVPNRIVNSKCFRNSVNIRSYFAKNIIPPFFYGFSCYLHNNTPYFNITTTFLKKISSHLLIAIWVKVQISLFHKYTKLPASCALPSLIKNFTHPFTTINT